jgi:hypothetical protein
VAPEGDLARLGETEVGRLAVKDGVDLLDAADPLLVAKRRGDRVFYVFWKTTANAFADRTYLIQRIKKIERRWAKAGEEKPEEKVTYQVEVFKVLGGRLKRPDQHHGSFGLAGAERREIVKEYEIGFGEIPGVCEGTVWPFEETSLFRLVQPYQEEVGVHPAVKFQAARRWTLTVAFERQGAWRVASPELGFDAPSKWPDPASAHAPPDSASKEVVLEAGVGLPGAHVGQTTAGDLVEALGKPLEDAPAGRGHRLMSFSRSLTVNLDPEGRVKTVITRPGFAGKTKEGVGHGATRAEVMGAMGPPKGQPADAVEWSYPGLLVVFDAFDRVVRLVVTRR